MLSLLWGGVGLILLLGTLYAVNILFFTSTQYEYVFRFTFGL